MEYSKVLRLNIEEFFAYIKTIKYGYKDMTENIHYDGDFDFEINKYQFSLSEEVIINNCGWCWDVANLIMEYCKRNKILYKGYFIEYKSSELHQTHTQVVIEIDGKWLAALDNSTDIVFGERSYSCAEECITEFSKEFISYLKHILKEKYSESYLTLKEFNYIVKDKISDDEYLDLIRSL